jgi:hypothetical protein
MAWRVTGTREKVYRVTTSADVLGWVDDEIEAMRSGWIPLSSESRPDGTLRVIYGRLPDETPVAAPPQVAGPAAHGSLGHAGWVMLIALAAAALMTMLATIAGGS